MALKFDKTFLVFFAIPFIADRITKYFILSGFWQSQSIYSVVNIYLTHNHGIAWGIGSQMHTHEYFLLNLLIGIVLVYFMWYMKSIISHHNLLSACLLIIAGGISNFFDRLWYGSVIDFIQFHIADWYFPVFNIADVSITIGALLLIYFVFFDEEK